MAPTCATCRNAELLRSREAAAVNCECKWATRNNPSLSRWGLEASSSRTVLYPGLYPGLYPKEADEADEAAAAGERDNECVWCWCMVSALSWTPPWTGCSGKGDKVLKSNTRWLGTRRWACRCKEAIERARDMVDVMECMDMLETCR